MSWYKFAAIVCAFAATTIANAEAQQAQSSDSAPTVVNPGDPRAAVPATEYRSAFSRYRPNVEAEVGSWRQKNDDVRRIGGWRVYGREAIGDSNAAEKESGDPKAPTDVAPKPAHGHRPPGVK